MIYLSSNQLLSIHPKSTTKVSKRYMHAHGHSNAINHTQWSINVCIHTHVCDFSLCQADINQWGQAERTLNCWALSLPL